MPDLLTSSFAEGLTVNPWLVLIRLVVSLMLGGVVAWIYKRTHKGDSSSLPSTLVLLAVLIAMVTQVIGDNVARAFSLVGALSIVRFRTVVRDTRDTAFVIFSVIVGMAVGSQHPWVAVIGIVVTGGAAFLLAGVGAPVAPSFILRVRGEANLDVGSVVEDALGEMAVERRLMLMNTSKKGAGVEVTYEVRLRDGVNVEQVAKKIQRMEGVQEVRILQRGFDQE